MLLNVLLLTGVSLICLFFSFFVCNCYYCLICHMHHARLLLEFNKVSVSVIYYICLFELYIHGLLLFSL